MPQPFDTPLPLFVYGTLLPEESNHRRFLAGRMNSCAPAETAGELWWVVEEDYPYLVPGPDRVAGCLVTLDPACYAETLAAIDRLEDFDPRHLQTSLYLRQAVQVTSGDGSSSSAWTYLWNRPARPGIRLSEGDFRKRPRR